MMRTKFYASTKVVGLLVLFTALLGQVHATENGSSDKAAKAGEIDSTDSIIFADLIDVDGSNSPVHPDIGQGKWTLVMLWATTCHICEIDKPLMSELHKKHKDGNIEVFGISIDGHGNMNNVQKYLAERDVSFPNSVGEFLTVSSSMLNLAHENLRGTPTYLLFGPDGEVKAVQAGHLSPDVVEKFVESNS